VVCGVPTDKRATVTVVSGERVHSAGTLTFDDDGVWVGDRWHALAGRVWRYDLTVAGPWSPK
jgi:hypothetical protein